MEPTACGVANSEITALPTPFLPLASDRYWDTRCSGAIIAINDGRS
jgi:hypothetical protein